MNEQKRKLILTLIPIALILFIATALIFYFFDSQKTATLSTKIVPLNATLTIDDKTYRPNTDYQLNPNSTTIIISAEGYQTQELPLVLSDNQTTTIVAALTPNNGDSSSYCISYNKECELFEEIMQIQSSQAAEEYFAKYPIATMLPIVVVEVDPETYDWTEYRIDGGSFDECKSSFCVKITDSTGGNREKALQKIHNSGFNPNDYEVIYEYAPITPLK